MVWLRHRWAQSSHPKQGIGFVQHQLSQCPHERIIALELKAIIEIATVKSVNRSGQAGWGFLFWRMKVGSWSKANGLRFTLEKMDKNAGRLAS
jgi:hypothetical protein